MFIGIIITRHIIMYVTLMVLPAISRKDGWTVSTVFPVHSEFRYNYFN